MTYPAKIVLSSPIRDARHLAGFVENCLRDRVELIAIVGEGCVDLENEIDELIVGDGTDDSRFIVTSCHPNEPFEDAWNMASIWSPKGENRVELVKL